MSDYSYLFTGTQAAIKDDIFIPGVVTIRHKLCCLLLPHDTRAVRCSKCAALRSVLKTFACFHHGVSRFLDHLLSLPNCKYYSYCIYINLQQLYFLTSEFGWSISIQNTVVTLGKCALLSSLEKLFQTVIPHVYVVMLCVYGIVH